MLFSYDPNRGIEGTPVPASFFGATFFSSSASNVTTELIGVIGTSGKKTSVRWVYVQPIDGSEGNELWSGNDDHEDLVGVLGLTKWIYSIDSTPGWAVASVFTVTIASPGVFTKASHGMSNGRAVMLTSTGDLPTGLTESGRGAAQTTYQVIQSATDTFQLAGPITAWAGGTTYAIGDVRHSSGNVYTSLQNSNTGHTPQFSATWWEIATTGTAINTSGSQSGVHTVRDLTTGHINTGMSSSGDQWESIYPPDDLAVYDTFISRYANRYPSKVLAFTPYTEPQSQTPAIPYTTLVTMTNRLVSHVHANHPGILVGTPTIQGRDDLLEEDWVYFDMFNNGMTTDVDTLHYHPYPAISVNTTERAYSRRANAMTVLLGNFPALASKPVWGVEGSWLTDAIATAAGTDKAAYVSQHLLLGWSVGDAVTVWYAPEDFGWGTLTGTPLTAYIETWDWMLGAYLQGTIDLTSNAREGQWKRPSPSGYTAYCVWTSDAASQSYTVPAGMNFLRRVDGTSEAVTPASSITITGKPIWLESHDRS